VGVLCEQIALAVFDLPAEVFFLIEFDVVLLQTLVRLFIRLRLRDVFAIFISRQVFL